LQEQQNLHNFHQTNAILVAGEGDNVATSGKSATLKSTTFWTVVTSSVPTDTTVGVAPSIKASAASSSIILLQNGGLVHDFPSVKATSEEATSASSLDRLDLL
jgi:hypothetical protein